METDTPVAAPKRKLRWYQYSLRTLLILVTLFGIACSWFAVKMNRAKKQKETIEKLQRFGGIVRYDYQEIGPRITITNGGKPRQPQWLRKLVGEHFFDVPVYVCFCDGPKSDEWVEAVNSLPSVKRLFLDRNIYINDKTLDLFGELPNVEDFQLTYSQATGRGLKNLHKFPNLRWLDLSNNIDIDSDLVFLKELKNLEELRLLKSDVSDDSITELSTMTTLQYLDVRKTAITEDGCKRLKKALPNCEILWEAK